MARLPLEPCLAKTMLCAVQSGCAPTAAAMCALVYGEDVFCRAGPEPLKQAAQEARKRYEAAEVRPALSPPPSPHKVGRRFTLPPPHPAAASRFPPPHPAASGHTTLSRPP